MTSDIEPLSLTLYAINGHQSPNGEYEKISQFRQ